MTTEPADEQEQPSKVKRPTGCLSGGTQEEPGPFSAVLMCPVCGSEAVEVHHSGSWVAPECRWFQCTECDWRSEPE